MKVHAILQAAAWLLAGSLLGGPLAAQAPKTPAPRPIGWKDVSNWRGLPPFGGVQLSADGRWLSYALLSATDGDGELIIRSTRDTVQYKNGIGATGFPQLLFSENGRWAAFKVFPNKKEKKAPRPTPDKLVLLNLETGKKTEFEQAGSFDFNGPAATHLAVLTAPPAAAGPPTPGSEPGPQGRDLLLVELATGRVQNIGNVSEMAFNKKGNWLALSIEARDKAGNGLHLRNMATGLTQVLDSDKATYRSLNWTDAGDGLALLKGTKDDKFKNDRYGLLGVRNLAAATPELVAYNPKTDSTRFPAGMTISPNRRPYWSDDLTRLFMGLHRLEPVKKEPAKPASAAARRDSARADSLKAIPKVSDTERLARIRADTSIRTLDELQKALARLKTDSARVARQGGSVPALMPVADKDDKPNVRIWNWQDTRLQSRQQVTERQDKNFSFLAMYDVSTKTFKQLADSSLRELNPVPKQRYAIAVNEAPYELDQSLDGQSYADVVVIDLKTGERRRVFEKLYLPGFGSAPMPSPDGSRFLYYKDGHYFSYDILTASSRNLTETAPTSFVNTEDDHHVSKPPTPPVGWSSDGRYVLVRDLWDVWKLDATGKDAPLNLTRNGRAGKIRYQNRYRFDPNEKGIDLSKPLFFRTYGERTKKSGLVRIDADKRGPVPGGHVLLWEDASIGNLMKARNAEVFVFSREDFMKPTEYFLSTSPALTNARQMTRNTPDFEKYAWSAGVRLVDYVSDKGDSLQGALFLPAGYEAGKKYPTVVYYYEKLSQTLHSFVNPGFSGTGWNPAVYTSNGYAVFIPDIVYRYNDPGMSAVWCVLPAVKAALKTGVIDEARMGIHGHSWGGYQTSFLITQTKMFKAAAAGAPLTDMISMYNLIYKNSGGGNMAIFEASQGRLGAPWDNWEAYYRNSPLHHVRQVQTPLLMLHNDADGAVDFTQGIEYYMALRRLKKPVVLVEYPGENHGLARLPNRRDYAVRMMEFFDHFLKGKPAPAWWQKGIDRLGMEDHLSERAVE